MADPYRILVTASRKWEDPGEMYAAFIYMLDYLGVDGSPVHDARGSDRRTALGHEDVTFIHGACPKGGDAFTDTFVTERGLRCERYPGKDFESFAARNQHMVDLGADVCLAFATDWASGTGQTARMARKAGIPTIDYGVDTRSEAAPIRHRSKEDDA